METLIIEQTDRENVSLRMRGQVLSEMNHTYLTNRIGLPNLEQFQLKTAIAILETAGCSKKETELITSVLLLIYHGLSVHENIDENQIEGNFRQLKVLAGDYYSSKYYYLLASQGQIELIGLFAEAVAKINEAKAERAALLRLDQSNTDKYLLLTERIHGELLYALCSRYLRAESVTFDLVRLLVKAHIFGIEYNQFLSGHWYANLSYLFIKEQATEEEIRLLASKHSYLQDSKIMTIHVKYGTSSYLFEQLQTGLVTVQSLLSVPDSPIAAERFNRICAFLKESYMETQRIVEER
ncbi:heptaprenyl diphosphate synthase component 1 [Effusibacillus consociatus]|uniref:Heptaprenyl diphosphate synthase component 1 n=1 Tax=Effusibacillus consociatus TaxID=1117041 RepID=A0ABV9Q4C4_9BACL